MKIIFLVCLVNYLFEIAGLRSYRGYILAICQLRFAFRHKTNETTADIFFLFLIKIDKKVLAKITKNMNETTKVSLTFTKLQ